MSMESSPINEQYLMERVRNGDPNAFREIYEASSKATYNFIFRKVRRKEVADEILQATFQAFYRKLGEGLQIDNLEAFLIGVARYNCFNYIRRNTNEISLDEAEFVQDPKNLMEEIEKQEKRKKVREGINKLPDKYKDPLILSVYEGWSDEKIATTLELPTNTIKTRKHKAKQILKEWLANLLTYFIFSRLYE